MRFRCPPDATERQRYILAALPATAAGSAAEDALATTAFTVSAVPPPLSPEARQCFAETRRCVADRFLAYWRYNGGLGRHGYPLTDERRERLEDGNEYLVQYFERTRLEYHPENAPPYDVLIGQLGRRFRPAEPPVTPLPGGGDDITTQPRYFPETGHNLARFRYYWTQEGGAEIFGLPLTEEVVERLEDGNEYLVQYFERAAGVAPGAPRRPGRRRPVRATRPGDGEATRDPRTAGQRRQRAAGDAACGLAPHPQRPGARGC